MGCSFLDVRSGGDVLAVGVGGDLWVEDSSFLNVVHLDGTASSTSGKSVIGHSIGNAIISNNSAIITLFYNGSHPNSTFLSGGNPIEADSSQPMTFFDSDVCI